MSLRSPSGDEAKGNPTADYIMMDPLELSPPDTIWGKLAALDPLAAGSSNATILNQLTSIIGPGMTQLVAFKLRHIRSNDTVSHPPGALAVPFALKCVGAVTGDIKLIVT